LSRFVLEERLLIDGLGGVTPPTPFMEFMLVLLRNVGVEERLSSMLLPVLLGVLLLTLLWGTLAAGDLATGEETTRCLDEKGLIGYPFEPS
jgi:hypothetical protein